jgi:ABC-2 type transport system ATP-binding protein
MYAPEVQDTKTTPKTTPKAAPVTRIKGPRPDIADGATAEISSVPAVQVRGLGKRYGDLWALRHLDLDVPRGSVLGLLGHNGAGKTTAIRILTTLALPTEGAASVAGYDVVQGADHVRRSIGVAGQEATVDGLLTAKANLVMMSRLHGEAAKVAKARADELLELVDLPDVGDKLTKDLSGGMRRRLDLAASLVSRPTVLFLDEPTTGLDPRSRNDLWDTLRALARDGTTIILTTQYLDEADRLADDIVVLDHGVTVAHGTPNELKARIGGDRVEVAVTNDADLAQVVDAARPFSTRAPSVDHDERTVTISVEADVRLMDIMRAVDAAGVDVIDINRRQATLDDVFLTLTAPDRMTEEEG